MRIIIGLSLIIISICITGFVAYTFFKGFNEIGEEENEL